MAEKMYRVRVLVGDDKPGLIPFTYHLPAANRDDAISTVRKRIRLRNMVVKHVDFAHQATVPGTKEGSFRPGEGPLTRRLR